VRENAKYKADEVLRKQFSGKRISQNFGKYFLKFGGVLDLDSARRKGLGGNARGASFFGGGYELKR